MSDRITHDAARWLPPKPSRSPWQRFYEAALERRRRFGGFEHLPGITWSIGNLHWGGGGKTPLVAEVGRKLLELGASVCILSRGYGRQGKSPVLVSRGDGPLCSAIQGGDEPHLLARTVPGLSVAVAPRRYDAGQLALRELSRAPDVFLLDDGFSHVRLARHLDLLAFPHADPFGGGRLFPSGRLREPLRAARHAAAAIVTGAPRGPHSLPSAEGGNAGLEPDLGKRLAGALRPFGFQGVGFAATTEAEILPAEGRAVPERVVLISGVARPAGVQATAESCGLEVAEHLSFADHHRYPPKSLRAIHRALENNPGSSLLATSKDLGKLTDRIQQSLAELRIRCAPAAGFGEWLGAKLAESSRAAPGGQPLASEPQAPLS